MNWIESQVSYRPISKCRWDIDNRVNGITCSINYEQWKTGNCYDHHHPSQISHKCSKNDESVTVFVEWVLGIVIVKLMCVTEISSMFLIFITYILIQNHWILSSICLCKTRIVDDSVLFDLFFKASNSNLRIIISLLQIILVYRAEPLKDILKE